MNHGIRLRVRVTLLMYLRFVVLSVQALLKEDERLSKSASSTETRSDFQQLFPVSPFFFFSSNYLQSAWECTTRFIVDIMNITSVTNQFTLFCCGWHHSFFSQTQLDLGVKKRKMALFTISPIAKALTSCCHKMNFSSMEHTTTIFMVPAWKLFATWSSLAVPAWSPSTLM